MKSLGVMAAALAARPAAAAAGSAGSTGGRPPAVIARKEPRAVTRPAPQA